MIDLDPSDLWSWVTLSQKPGLTTQDHLDAKMEANRMLRRRLLRRIRVERPLRDRQNPLLAWTEEETYSYLRFGPEVVMYITQLLSPRLERPTRRSGALPALLQVILALHLLASGSFLNVVRRLVGVSTSTCCRVVWGVINALCALRNDLLKWPASPEEVRKAKHDFFQLNSKCLLQMEAM